MRRTLKTAPMWRYPLSCTATLGLAAAWVAAAIAISLAPPARAAGEPKPLELVVHPAPAPYPVMKYLFHPDLAHRYPGNAAVEYGKVTAEQGQTFGNADLWKDILRWLEAPLADLRKEEAYKKTNFDKMFYDLDHGAACEYCDWQLPIGREPFYSIYLSELQQTRNFARLLGVRARAQIAEGRFDEAVARLRAGYRLAQHVDEGPTLIHSLVSAAIAKILSAQVQEFVQQPGAPNLYWALTALPSPLIDARPGIDGERDALYLTFEDLDKVEAANWPAERWQGILERVAAGMAEHRVLQGDADPRKKLADRTSKLLPTAKQYLIEHGCARDQVEVMPVPQIAMLYSVKLYNELRDEMLKWYYVPYWQARKHLEQVTDRVERLRREQQEILPLASETLPAMLRARDILVRADRDIALWRQVEALRMFGAAHQSQFPEKLSEITEVAIPLDPVSGEPFQYTLRGATAVIEGRPLPEPANILKDSPKQDVPLHMEVRFAK
jgi:hypothetical protein